MKSKHAGWAVALAAILAAPAFAQTAVVSATGPVVTSGTGITVTPGAPSTMPVIVGASTVPGSVVAEIASNTTVNGNTKTTVTNYWVNVPPHAEQREDFRRWQMLK